MESDIKYMQILNTKLLTRYTHRLTFHLIYTQGSIPSFPLTHSAFLPTLYYALTLLKESQRRD